MATNTFKVLLVFYFYTYNPNLNESLLILLIAFLFPVVLFAQNNFEVAGRIRSIGG
jgi:hypothetical protein